MSGWWTGKEVHFPFRSLPVPASVMSPKEHCICPWSLGMTKEETLPVLCLFLNPQPQKHLESYLVDCYDAIAVFLCIHIVLRFRNITAKRDVPALDRSLVPFVCLEAVLLPPHSPLTPTPASTDGHPSIRFQPPPPHP